MQFGSCPFLRSLSPSEDFGKIQTNGKCYRFFLLPMQLGFLYGDGRRRKLFQTLIVNGTKVSRTHMFAIKQIRNLTSDKQLTRYFRLAFAPTRCFQLMCWRSAHSVSQESIIWSNKSSVRYDQIARLKAVNVFKRRKRKNCRKINSFVLRQVTQKTFLSVGDKGVVHVWGHNFFLEILKKFLILKWSQNLS